MLYIFSVMFYHGGCNFVTFCNSSFCNYSSFFHSFIHFCLYRNAGYISLNVLGLWSSLSRYGSVQQRLENSFSKHVFVKDIGCAIGKDDLEFIPAGYKHTFLIRHPLRVLGSNRAAMFEQLSQLDALTGEAANENTFDLEHDDPYMTPGLLFRDIYDVWQHVRKNANAEPIVIDADDLLTKPAEVLSKYCNAVGLPYDESLLNLSSPSDLDVFKIWRSPIGANELQMTVSAFSKTAMKSTAFMPPKEMPERDHMTPDVIRSVDRIIEYYDEMYEHRMKV